MKRAESQKRNSQRLSTPQDHDHGNGRMVYLNKLTDQFRDYTGQRAVSKEDHYELEDHRIAQTGVNFKRSLLQPPAHSRLRSQVRPGSSVLHPVGPCKPPKTTQSAHLSDCPHREIVSPCIQAEPF